MMKRPALPLALLPLAVLFGCGGDATSPTGQTVTVTVTTSGENLDADGYTVGLGDRSAVVEASGSVSFENVAAGVHALTMTGVADNCEVDGGPTRQVTVEAGTGAQASFAVACQAEAGSGLTPVACPDLALSATAGVPLDEIPIGSLPAEFNVPVAASVGVGVTGGAGFAFVRTAEPDNAEDPRLIVPLHPETPLEGGPVTFTITDGLLVCAPVDFLVEPLPAADGEFAAIVDLLQGILDHQAAAVQTTGEALTTTPILDLPLELWPMAMARTLLDDPSNNESLRAVAGGSQGSEAVLWLDRLFARTAVRATLAVPSGTSLTAVAGFTAASTVSALQCRPEFVTGSVTSVLHDCMQAAAEASLAAQSWQRGVEQDVQKILAAASQSKIPTAAVVEAVVGFIFFLMDSDRARAMALYPSSFTSMSVDIDRPRFLEDEEAQGRVTSASVTATNEGYNLLKEIIDGVSKATALAENTGDFEFSESEGNDVAAFLRGKIQQRLEERLGELGLEEFDIEPEDFGPVHLAPVEDWVEAEVVGGNAIELLQGTLVYEPFLDGTASLHVRTADDKFGRNFGGDQIVEAVEVTVLEIQLDMSPDEAVVGPEGARFFTVTAHDSEYPEMVEIDPSVQLQGQAVLQPYAGDGTHTILYVAPAEPDFATPDLLTVRHTATTGARANSTEERLDYTTISFGDISISPRTHCLAPGDTLAFTAEVEPTGQNVVWEVDVGTIDGSSGLYTAPATAPSTGTATITAHIEAFPDIEDEVTIQIGSCTCGWAVTLDGATTESEEGDWAGFLFTEQGTVAEITLHDTSADVGASFTPEGPIFPSAPGTFPTSVSGRIGAGGLLYFRPAEQALSLVVDEWEAGTDLAGSVSGFVDLFETGSSDPVGTALLEATFRIPDAAFNPSHVRWSCTVPASD